MCEHKKKQIMRICREKEKGECWVHHTWQLYPGVVTWQHTHCACLEHMWGPLPATHECTIMSHVLFTIATCRLHHYLNGMVAYESRKRKRNICYTWFFYISETNVFVFSIMSEMSAKLMGTQWVSCMAPLSGIVLIYLLHAWFSCKACDLEC